MPTIALKTSEETHMSLDSLDIATLKDALIKKTMFISPEAPLPSYYVKLSRDLYNNPEWLMQTLEYSSVSAKLLLDLLKY